MKYFFIIPLSIAFSSFWLLSDVEERSYSGDIKQKVVSITLEGTPIIEKVDTLERPIITRQSIERKLKGDLVNFYSYPVENIEPHLNKYKALFEPEFFSEQTAQTKANVRALLESEVRVVDFLILGKPMYIGSKRGQVRNWDFVINGYSVYQGNFSGSRYQFRKERKVISVKESPTRNGNPSGVEIYAVREF